MILSLKIAEKLYKMGVKSASNAKNMPRKYAIKGLIFSNKDVYECLKNIDLNAYQLVAAIKAGSLDMKEFFGRYNKVKVKETYAGAAENLEVLFENITRLISINDPDYFKTELDFSAYFHSKIDVEFFDD